MTELLTLVTNGTLPIGFAVVVFLILAAMQLPKIVNAMKGDRIDGNLLERVEKLEEKTHLYAVKITRLTVIMLRLEGILIAKGIEIPPELTAEIEELRDGL